MRIILLIMTVYLTSLTGAQPAGFQPGQVWTVDFRDANGWQLSLNASSAEGLTGTATSSSFGAALDAAVAGLDPEDLTLLGLSSGDYVGVLISYPAAVATPGGGDMLLCSLPARDLSQGQAFELRRESTGLRVVAAGNTCSAALQGARATSLTDDVPSGSASWPPALSVGETWQLSVTQGGAKVAAWTVELSGGGAQALTGRATGTDTRTVEVEYLRDEAPTPSLRNSWVFALSAEGAEPFYCAFAEDKPYSANEMTGSVLLAGATCTLTKQ